KKRVPNLVIHELLVGTDWVSVPLLEFLIGGPNQSHKVNFKEPLPFLRERVPRRHLLVSRSTLFSKFFSETASTSSSCLERTPLLHAPVFAGQVVKGERTMDMTSPGTSSFLKIFS